MKRPSKPGERARKCHLTLHAIADALEKEAQRLRTLADFDSNRQALAKQIQDAADPDKGGWGQDAWLDEIPLMGSIHSGDIEVIELKKLDLEPIQDGARIGYRLRLRLGEERFDLAFNQERFCGGDWNFGSWEMTHPKSQQFVERLPAVAGLLAYGVFSRAQPEVRSYDSALGNAVAEKIQNLVEGQLDGDSLSKRETMDDGPSV